MELREDPLLSARNKKVRLLTRTPIDAIMLFVSNILKTEFYTRKNFRMDYYRWLFL